MNFSVEITVITLLLTIIQDPNKPFAGRNI